MIGFCSIAVLSCYADRIYIMNSSGYNTAETALVNEIISNGHTVTINNTTFTLPPGFTSTCNDPVNGYDWLCFFGDNDFSGMLPQIQTFIDAGGKVFCQYEVSCCTNSSTAAAAVASGLTGLSITPNFNSYIGLNPSPNIPGWQAANVSCCATFKGNAYKGMDGLPVANQLQATGTLNSGAPPVSTCPNFGFVFTTTDFSSGANHGALVGVGDINFWYDGGEPVANGGTLPVNPATVDYFFPGAGATCFLLPPGCMMNYTGSSSTITVNLGNDTTLCQGATLTLNAGNPGDTYVWQDNSTNQTFTVTGPGTYWVQVTGSCGSDADTIVVNYTPIPTVNLGNDTSFCPGDQLVLDVTTAGATYLWQDNSTNATYTVNSAGTYSVVVDVNGCSASDSMDVTYGNSISVSLGNDTSFCVGAAYQLNTTTAGATYLWQDNSTNPTLNVTTTGTYWVQVTNSCGTATDSVNISFNAAPAVSLGNDTTLCQGAFIDYHVTTAGATYLWQDNSTSDTYHVTQPGTYWVQVDVNGCEGTDSATVLYINLPLPALGNDTTLCEGASMVLHVSSPGAAYLWQDSTTNASFSVNAQGTYWVRITNSCGIVTDSIDISFQNCDCALYIPNSFTPNDDKMNNFFYPVTNCSMINYRFTIFDRWGKEMYTTSDPTARWDGTIHGKPVQIGVYVYRLTYQFNIPQALPELKTGHINLLR